MTALPKRALAAAVVVLGCLTAASCTAAGASDDPAEVPAAREAPAGWDSARIGSFFTGPLDGGHFCSAAVVDSPGHNLLVTAAHCFTGGEAGLSFVPGYRTDKSPHGVWKVRSVTVDPRWVDSDYEDPVVDALDVAFVELEPLDGRNLQDVVGAYDIAFGKGAGREVTVFGYPGEDDKPVRCRNSSTLQDDRFPRFACTGFTEGTSGGPWIADLSSKKRSGTVVGVIGGYEGGGNTPDVSYSPPFGDEAKAVYERVTGLAGGAGRSQ